MTLLDHNYYYIGPPGVGWTVEGGEGAVGVAIHCLSIIPATPGSPGDTPEWIKPVGTGWVRQKKTGPFSFHQSQNAYPQ